jgi:hypothetical protein
MTTGWSIVEKLFIDRTSDFLAQRPLRISLMKKHMSYRDMWYSRPLRHSVEHCIKGTGRVTAQVKAVAQIKASQLLCYFPEVFRTVIDTNGQVRTMCTQQARRAAQGCRLFAFDIHLDEVRRESGQGIIQAHTTHRVPAGFDKMSTRAQGGVIPTQTAAV